MKKTIKFDHFFISSPLEIEGLKQRQSLYSNDMVSSLPQPSLINHKVSMLTIFFTLVSVSRFCASINFISFYVVNLTSARALNLSGLSQLTISLLSDHLPVL